jgi:diaminopropionate ammonia-lyase
LSERGATPLHNAGYDFNGAVLPVGARYLAEIVRMKSGLAGLIQAAGSAEDRAALGLDRDSHVLLLNTEGATAPALYEQITGLRAADVQKARQRRLPVQATTVTAGSAAANAASRSAAGG